jgi:hypothetical protein
MVAQPGNARVLRELRIRVHLNFDWRQRERQRKNAKRFPAIKAPRDALRENNGEIGVHHDFWRDDEMWQSEHDIALEVSSRATVQPCDDRLHWCSRTLAQRGEVFAAWSCLAQRMTRAHHVHMLIEEERLAHAAGVEPRT